MPHATLKMRPGVNVTETPTLNEISYQSTNLARFIPDAKGLGLAQKMGGWTPYYGSSLSSTIRALKGFADISGNNYLGIGAQASLSILNSSKYLQDITPQYQITNVTPNFSTSIASTVVTVVDNSFSPTVLDYVYYETPVAVGGITLYGSYPIFVSTGTSYEINADSPAIYGGTITASACSIAATGGTGGNGVLTIGGTVVGKFGPGMTVTGGTIPAGTVIVDQLTGTTGLAGTYTVTTNTVVSSTAITGNVPASYAFSTVNGQQTVAVTFPNHNLSVGRTIYIAVPTTVGGVTLSGQYTVTSLGGITGTPQSACTQQMFCIVASAAATSTAGPTYTNTGLIESYYFISGGSVPAGSGYGAGGYGIGGYGVGVSPTALFTASISGTTLNVTALTSGTLLIGQYVSGSGVASGTKITAYGSGSGGIGTYTVNVSQTISSEAMSSSLNSSGVTITATDWTLDNFGQDLIACPAGVPPIISPGVTGTPLSPIYYYQPGGALTNAQILGEQTPLVNEGFFIAMPERQIVAYGSSFNLAPDPLNVRWSDAGDPTTWIATSTNQAGSYRIPSGSKIVTGIQGPQQGLLWTDIDIWAMQYVGLPFVYGFNKIGTNCGAISRKCVGTINNVVYWMSQNQFFVLTGSGPTPLPCTVWDAVFQNLNKNSGANGIPYTQNIRCAVNSQFNEITWFYPSASSANGENDSYVKYNTVLQCWDYGSLGRTAWIDQSVLGPPIGSGTDNWIYQHEIGNDASVNGTTTPMATSFQTGFFQVAEGDNLVFIDQIWPDLKFNTYSPNAGSQPATVNLTIYYTNYPVDTTINMGSYTGSSGNYPGGTVNSTVSSLTFPITSSTEYISCRIRARFMAFSMTNASGTAGTNTFWRLGAMKFRYQPDGRF
jgi:hypothetical protein